ncbi:MAG: amino acid--tRNA ligase-related protein [Myxococcota bacterium]|nr:amino acid--tRNA ligase-related protein [Myxococcota bacterium]
MSMSLASKNKSTIIRQKSVLLHAIRTWFWENGYLEVQTPILVPSPAMEEHLEALPCRERWLHTSPEFAMKRLLTMGMCRIYQIVPCFRDEEVGVHHSREFSMLEWYRVGIGTADLMNETEALLQTCADALGVSLPTIQRIRTSELLDPKLSPEDWLFTWVDQIEPRLPRGAIVFDYPQWASALSRIRGQYADRFELYIDGIELANAFYEEREAQEVRHRWEKNNNARIEAGKNPHPIDHHFLDAVDRLPRCSGIALGLDRLLMVLLNVSAISHTQLELEEDSHDA